MRRLTIVLALLLSCIAAPVTVPSPSPTATASPIPLPSPTASPSPRRPDLTIVPAGQISGDHALVLQFSQQPGGATSAMRFWDVPLDGSPPKQLLSYNRGEQLLTDFDYFDFSRQLSPDGRQLVLTDPVDIAGRGLLVVDLVAGTTRAIATSGAASNPAWSPDGQRIAYRGFTVAGPFQKESGLWVVPASVGAPHEVWTSDRPAGAGAATIYGWTEDGAAIAFSRDSTEVSIVDVTTQKVSHVAGSIHGIAWRAKHPSVAIVVDDEAAVPSPSGPRGAPSSIVIPAASRHVTRPSRRLVRCIATATSAPCFGIRGGIRPPTRCCCTGSVAQERRNGTSSWWSTPSRVRDAFFRRPAACARSRGAATARRSCIPTLKRCAYGTPTARTTASSSVRRSRLAPSSSTSAR